ncbi:hypothetical protein RRG08_005684 [Elysia crispata]|uniref:Uncharacterized protein n=1 Tax=Elysia crispata TaxID=231223 RepID=A0AAE0YCU4_9GAST|nr:hypothetical protein RRG08_005684 [Elysia crispata]
MLTPQLVDRKVQVWDPSGQHGVSLFWSGVTNHRDVSHEVGISCVATGPAVTPRIPYGHDMTTWKGNTIDLSERPALEISLERELNG